MKILRILGIIVGAILVSTLSAWLTLTITNDPSITIAAFCIIFALITVGLPTYLYHKQSPEDRERQHREIWPYAFAMILFLSVIGLAVSMRDYSSGRQNPAIKILSVVTFIQVLSFWQKWRNETGTKKVLLITSTILSSAFLLLTLSFHF